MCVQSGYIYTIHFGEDQDGVWGTVDQPATDGEPTIEYAENTRSSA